MLTLTIKSGLQYGLRFNHPNKLLRKQANSLIKHPKKRKNSPRGLALASFFSRAYKLDAVY
jgi:hypothetical protein